MTPLKTRLISIRENNFLITQESDRIDLLEEILEYIGSPDSELRDDLIYTCLYEWIVRKSLLSKRDLYMISQTLQDPQHMFFCIGDKNTDSVFTRSFSVLAFALVIYSHRQTAFLSKTEILEIFESLCRYLHMEKDLRGYVFDRGWAHAIAHSADALDELVQCTEINQSELREIEKVIEKTICTAEVPFIHREDERMAAAQISLMHRDLLPESELASFLSNLNHQAIENRSDPTNFCYYNIRNFLNSLFFKIQVQKIDNSLLDLIQSTIIGLY